MNKKLISFITIFISLAGLLVIVWLGRSASGAMQIASLTGQAVQDDATSDNPALTEINIDNDSSMFSSPVDTAQNADTNSVMEKETENASHSEREEYTENASQTDSDTESALSQAEQDALHASTRKEAALPYESQILPEYLSYYQQNPYVIGYIRLAGTDVDCPVLQKLEDYEYYLTHDISNQDSEQGCIILDPDSEIGIGTQQNGYLTGYEPSTVQLVHGHNMKSGTMFGALQNYASEAYAAAHPYISFDSLYEKRTYRIICAFYSQIYPEDSDVFKYYNFNQAQDEEDFNNWYDNIKKLALYQTEEPVSYGDEIITLSTCSYQTENGRFAVVGKRID